MELREGQAQTRTGPHRPMSAAVQELLAHRGPRVCQRAGRDGHVRPLSSVPSKCVGEGVTELRGENWITSSVGAEGEKGLVAFVWALCLTRKAHREICSNSTQWAKNRHCVGHCGEDNPCM